MMESEHGGIDPNTADSEVLRQLPGIGPAMAERIMAARPFGSAEDLMRVRGIGPTVLERMRPLLGLSSAPAGSKLVEAEVKEVKDVPVLPSPKPAILEAKAPPQVAEEVAIVEAEEPSPAFLEPEAGETEGPPAVSVEPVSPESPPEKEVPAPASERVPSPARQRPAVTRAYVGWLVGAGGMLAVLVGLALSLGILAALNGGQLQFVKPAQFGELQVEVEGLATRAGVLEQDIEGLRTRLNNLEALSGRVSSLEQVVEELQSDLGAAETKVDSLAGQVEALQSELDDLTGQLDEVRSDLTGLTEQLGNVKADVQTLQTQADRFQSFFDGLRDLIDALFQPEGGTQ